MNDAGLYIDPSHFRYKAMIGTGGIGAGSLFLLTGDHTLGREESRGGRYLDARDYCKLHIIAHNVKMLCGESFPVYPIGKIGDDEVGRRISHEMTDAGLQMDYVHTSEGDSTLFGFCFLYPDGTGGNLTTEESACSKVDPALIERAAPTFAQYAGAFISLAAPEVSLMARKKLLELTRQHGGFAVASFTTGEMKEAVNTGMLAMVDLLAINADEAAALCGVDANDAVPEEIVKKAIEKMGDINPAGWLSVTAGRHGSWSWDGHELEYCPSLSVKVKSSAGAGDAHISAVISGLVAGLPLQQAQVLGNLAGALAVMSQHTICPEMGAPKLAELADLSGSAIDPEVMSLLRIPADRERLNN